MARTKRKPDAEPVETFEFMGIVFDVTKAKRLAGDPTRSAARVQTAPFDSWLTMIGIDEKHALSDKIDLNEPVIIGVLPNDFGRLLLDGNHRMWRALHDKRTHMPALILDADETRACCMNPTLWNALAKPREGR
jgi:hypothetical protein